MNSVNGKSVLIIDDHKLIVVGTKAILENSDFNFKKIEGATTGKEALAQIERQHYDIYIVDIELPDINGFDLIEAIRKLHPQAHIIVNTIHEELSFFRKLEKYNVDAVVCKSLDTEAIEEAVRAVLAHKTYVCEKAHILSENKTAPQTAQDINLSKSEIKVLELIAKGMSTTAIAESLFVSTNTIETHRRHINEKLGTKNMAGMIIKGLKLGLLDIE